MASRDDKREESPIYLLGLLGLILCVLVFLVWLVASNRIVYGSLTPALSVGALWKLIPSDFTYLQWNDLAGQAVAFSRNPTKVTLTEWAAFITQATRPLAILLVLGYLGFLITLAFKRKPDLKRRLSADQLMFQTVEHFTGIAPVVCIRKDIVSDKNVLWRRQVTPEEVFLNFKVPRTKAPSSGSLAKPGAPMMRDGAFDREVARAYFIGAEEVLKDGRLVSRMLGRQVVNLPMDAKKAKSMVFSDRMSSEGKVLIGLWSAVAFGGVPGRDEYIEYRDKLNRSAFGTKDGIANLSLAQPLYEKYRKHPLLNKLFSIHHWEHTALFALLALAQKKGRYTTAEVLWLRPTNRVMFFTLNTRGAYTPHTEAGATFAQHAYEISVAKLNRLPLMIGSTGAMTHVIYIDEAVSGLELECLRWIDADSDDDEDWWQKKDVWKRADTTIVGAMKAVVAAVPAASMPGVSGDETAFDKLASEQARAKEAASAAKLATEFSTQPVSFEDFLSGKNIS